MEISTTWYNNNEENRHNVGQNSAFPRQNTTGVLRVEYLNEPLVPHERQQETLAHKGHHQAAFFRVDGLPGASRKVSVPLYFVANLHPVTGGRNFVQKPTLPVVKVVPFEYVTIKNVC